MLYPSINLLREKVDSKYTLVAMASKRARDIIDGKPVLVKPGIDKPVSIATEEIAEDKLTYRRRFRTEQEALEYEHEQHMAAVEAAHTAADAGGAEVPGDVIEYTAVVEETAENSDESAEAAAETEESLSEE